MITNDHPMIKAAMEISLLRHTEWLNAWHEDHGDVLENGAPVRVTRENYDEYDDPAKILNWVFTDRLMVTIYANPYHDEGGPTILTAIFEHAFELSDNEQWGYDPHKDMPLEILIMSFDTLAQVIWDHGEFRNTPGDQ